MTRQEEIINVSNELFNSFRCSKSYKMGFEVGVMWADKNPKSPWINVKDDLPCNHKELTHSNYTNRVLILEKSGLIEVAFMYIIKGVWEWATPIHVVYWMPLPKFPKDIIYNKV